MRPLGSPPGQPPEPQPGLGRPETGFTLVEVLVALVILAVAVVSVLQLFGGGLRLLRVSGDHVGATLVANAKLAEIPAGPLEEGAAEGTEGPYQWTRRIALDPTLLPIEATSPEVAKLALARVSVEVRWGASRRVALVTLRTWSKTP